MSAVVPDQEDQSDAEMESDPDDDGKRVILIGVCAMEKKSRSRPMTEILSRLEERFEYIRPVIFDETVILNVSNR
jgi:inositol hexakisphosphate/diphosphoinositol-pentakisphosphate kinase